MHVDCCVCMQSSLLDWSPLRLPSRVGRWRRRSLSLCITQARRSVATCHTGLTLHMWVPLHARYEGVRPLAKVWMYCVIGEICLESWQLFLALHVMWLCCVGTRRQRRSHYCWPGYRGGGTRWPSRRYHTPTPHTHPTLIVLTALALQLAAIQIYQSKLTRRAFRKRYKMLLL